MTSETQTDPFAPNSRKALTETEIAKALIEETERYKEYQNTKLKNVKEVYQEFERGMKYQIETHAQTCLRWKKHLELIEQELEDFGKRLSSHNEKQYLFEVLTIKVIEKLLDLQEAINVYKKAGVIE